MKLRFFVPLMAGLLVLGCVNITPPNDDSVQILLRVEELAKQVQAEVGFSDATLRTLQEHQQQIRALLQRMQTLEGLPQPGPPVPTQ